MLLKKRNILLFIFFTGPCFSTYTSQQVKYIVWDLGSTLTNVSHLAIARELGVKHIMSMFWHIGTPKTIRQKMFQLLEDYGGRQQVPNKEDPFTYDDNGMPLPHFMSDTWLCSRVPNKEIIAHIHKAATQWRPKGGISRKQRELLRRTVLIALSAAILGKHTRSVSSMLDLVKKYNAQGYTQYILSNCEKEAFNRAYVNKENKEIFRYFKRENIVISGECGMIKPHRCIYQYFLEKYNLKPEECLLIDDRPENVIVARKCGMRAILLEKGKYRKLARTLEKVLG